jgi:tol-pal system protein YbgF
MGVLRDLVQQTADSVNRMSQTIDALEKKLNAQQDAANSKVDQVSGQVQTLNDSVDEVKARMNALEKAMQAIQNQQQSINAALQNMNTGGTPAGGTAPASGQAPSGQPPSGPNAQPTAPGGSASNVPTDSPFATQQGPPRLPNTAPTGPPVGELYKTALADFMAAKYSLATSEFHDVIQNYPDDTLSGNAYFYLGEIDYHAGHFADAVKNYDHVIQQFPANPKVPVSRLHKGSALLAMKDRQAGIDEMRALILRFPNSPEAAQARTKLSGLGVSVTSTRPATRRPS